MRSLQFEFTEEAIKEIDHTQICTNLPSRVEVIRHALRFLQWAVDETSRGSSIWLEKDGKVREIIPFWKII